MFPFIVRLNEWDTPYEPFYLRATTLTITFKTKDRTLVGYGVQMGPKGYLWDLMAIRQDQLMASGSVLSLWVFGRYDEILCIQHVLGSGHTAILL